MEKKTTFHKNQKRVFVPSEEQEETKLMCRPCVFRRQQEGGILETTFTVLTADSLFAASPAQQGTGFGKLTSWSVLFQHCGAC